MQRNLSPNGYGERSTRCIHPHVTSYHCGEPEKAATTLASS
uniref:Uncharacterized protein n=1 Tax=Siphoviridae sp. cttU829 TaxID=2823605 RepID=A0A8S5LC45_9CAUD|nr:MAG TPA: hypothetical protein [Siphoviridae sp. cttU829]